MSGLESRSVPISIERSMSIPNYQRPTSNHRLHLQTSKGDCAVWELGVGNWQLIMIPDQIRGSENRAGKARSYVVVAAAGLAHRDDAAIAAAHPAAHHSLHGHLGWRFVGSCHA